MPLSWPFSGRMPASCSAARVAIAFSLPSRGLASAAPRCSRLSRTTTFARSPLSSQRARSRMTQPPEPVADQMVRPSRLMPADGGAVALHDLRQLVCGGGCRPGRGARGRSAPPVPPGPGRAGSRAATMPAPGTNRAAAARGRRTGSPEAPTRSPPRPAALRRRPPDGAPRTRSWDAAGMPRCRLIFDTRLGRQQRVAAELEEVVVDADLLDARAPRPDRGQQLLHRPVRGAHVLRRGRCARSGAGSASRSTLPFGVSGRASRTTKADGTMYSGSASSGSALAQTSASRSASALAGTT